MSITIEQRVKNEVKEFKADVDQLEEYVKQWEQEFHLKEIGKASEKCYDAFDVLQTNLAKLSDKSLRDKIQLDCYQNTKRFLSYFESEATEDVVILILNHCRWFARLFKHCSDYCSKVERDYNIQLDSEKEIRANEDLFLRLKSLRGL